MEIEEFIKKYSKGEYIEEAQRFTVDSILGDYLRILVTNLARPVQKHLGIAGLVRFDVWEEEREKVVKREEAARMIGVRPARLLERRVFIRIQRHAFEITQRVRQESKSAYKPLLSREMRARVPSIGKSEES